MQSPQTAILSSQNIQELADRQWTVLDLNSSPFSLTLPLQKWRTWAETLWSQDKFKAAAIGRGAEQGIHSTIRSDSIFWLESENVEMSEAFAFLEKLRMELNQSLLLGIQAFEAHFARYADGQAYKEHIDQPKRQSFLHGERLVSFVFYLNHDWKPTDGGQLQIRDSQGHLHAYDPQWGRLILFDSKTILHQVLPSIRERWSLTGWFRRS